jgi:hypothetical protein
VRFHFTIQDTGIGVPVDMQMPVMDGIEATQKIRVKELGRRLIRRSSRLPPTLLTTTGANAFDAGMDGYVVKPVSAKAIGDEVGRVMALFIETQPEAVQKWRPGTSGRYGSWLTVCPLLGRQIPFSSCFRHFAKLRACSLLILLPLEGGTKAGYLRF